MGAYLIDHPPAVRQWYDKRTKPLTGCTVLHTSESVMDTVGPDTGAEAVAKFIAGRTTSGSYHDLVDSDSWVPLIPYRHGAFHDATGSNNWALSLSFACRTSDWRTMSAAKRAAFLTQGARAFAAQQEWRAANGFPLTELRLITKAQSDAGQSGFIYHGHRDPGRRSDPGVASPNLFPFVEWIAHCRTALAESNRRTTTTQGDDMQIAELYGWRDTDGRNMMDKLIHLTQRVDQLHGKADGIATIRTDLAQVKATLTTIEADTSDAETALDEVMAKLDALAATTDPTDPAPTDPTPVKPTA